MNDYAKNFIKEAQHAKKQALECEERANAFLTLWAKTMCPYKVGEKIQLPENIWEPHNEAFRIFNGLSKVSENTEFLVKDIVFNDEIGINGDYDEDELSWAMIVSRIDKDGHEMICKIDSYHLNKES